MPIRFIAFASLAFAASAALGANYLCVGEAGAAVEHGGASGISAGLTDATKKKYLLSNADGTWHFRELGEDKSLLVCTSQYYCEVPGGFSAYFMRENGSNVFTYVGVVATGQDLKRSVTFVIKGRCSAL